MLQSDFNFVVLLLEEFFSQKHIRKRLVFIKKHEVTGWEIWLQIEFSVFIEGCIDVDEWFREWRYDFDKRKVKSKNSMAIDFLLRKKHAALEQYIALELKQNNNIRVCLKGMFLDLEKVNSMKESGDDIRSFWNIGVHPTSEKLDINKRIQAHREVCSIKLMDKRIKTVEIKGTPFSYTVL